MPSLPLRCAAHDTTCGGQSVGKGDTCVAAQSAVQQDSLFGQKNKEESAGAVPGSHKNQAGPAERSSQCSLI